MRIPIFGFHILTSATVAEYEATIATTKLLNTQLGARIINTKAELDSANQRLEDAVKVSTTVKHKAALFKDAVSLQLEDARGHLLAVERLIAWRNGDAFKAAGPRERSEFPSKLSEAYDAAAQKLSSLTSYINEHKPSAD